MKEKTPFPLASISFLRFPFFAAPFSEGDVGGLAVGRLLHRRRPADRCHAAVAVVEMVEGEYEFPLRGGVASCVSGERKEEGKKAEKTHPTRCIFFFVTEWWDEGRGVLGLFVSYPVALPVVDVEEDVVTALLLVGYGDGRAELRVLHHPLSQLFVPAPIPTVPTSGQSARSRLGRTRGRSTCATRGDLLLTILPRRLPGRCLWDSDRRWRRESHPRSWVSSCVVAARSVLRTRPAG